MFSSESTCNHHKTTFPGERYNTCHTHTRTHQLEQKITALRSRDIDCDGVNVDTAPVDDIEGFNGKDNNSNGWENDPDKKMCKLFMYEE